MEEDQWPAQFPVAQIRVARPTNQLQRVLQFYRDGIGLQVIDAFEAHKGYSGVMLGLPGHRYHLEFTQHEHGTSSQAPSRDNLLVFYIPDKEAIAQVVKRLGALGYQPVPPENPYWDSQGVTFEDPEGWRVVLMNTTGI